MLSQLSSPRELMSARETALSFLCPPSPPFHSKAEVGEAEKALVGEWDSGWMAWEGLGTADEQRRKARDVRLA